VGASWESQGYLYDGIAWYRARFLLPAVLKKQSILQDSIIIELGKIDDQDTTYLNGVPIGSNGQILRDPADRLRKDNSSASYMTVRRYVLSTRNPALLWDKENVLSVRVNDTGGDGGMIEGPYSIRMLDITDQMSIGTQSPCSFIKTRTKNRVRKQVALSNSGSMAFKGLLTIRVMKGLQNVSTNSSLVTIQANTSKQVVVDAPNTPETKIIVAFKEARTKKPVITEFQLPYLLTPAPGPKPRINGADIAGLRSGSDFSYTIAATGSRPLIYRATGLPLGLHLDPQTGLITGKCTRPGNYRTIIEVTNSAGRASRELLLVVGNKIGLTPAMGWNSWNAFGLSINSEKVKQAVDAMVASGLRDHGYTYVNIDDGWEDSTRDAAGNIRSNSKFPNMNELTAYIHSKGFKAGIYSSPGPYTCGHFLGSWQHERQDAKTWAEWKFDYIKYDWCSYGGIDTTRKKTVENFMRPYITMQQALAATGRDIYYSLCQYGMGNVWRWGARIDANSWRTTGDINDTWGSLSSIGFNQDTIASFAKPGGGWNDPDMLVVGNVGWGPTLHPSRLTPDEQYTHISLWSLLSAPLLIGCDVTAIDSFTLNLLTNDEVIAIDQDRLGNEARRKANNAGYQVWVKTLVGGHKAVGIFNMLAATKQLTIEWATLKIARGRKIRDVWRQAAVGTTEARYSVTIPPHGVTLLRIE